MSLFDEAGTRRRIVEDDRVATHQNPAAQLPALFSWRPAARRSEPGRGRHALFRATTELENRLRFCGRAREYGTKAREPA